MPMISTLPPGASLINSAQIAKEQAAKKQSIEMKAAQKAQAKATSIIKKTEETTLNNQAALEKIAQKKEAAAKPIGGQAQPAADSQPGKILNIIV